MIDPQLQAQIDAALAYEELLVPALFGQWAEQVVNVARIRPGDRVLDVACGTGSLARAAVRRVAPSGFVSGIDPNPGMLEVAGRRSPEVDWRRGSAETLPYPNESFDVVVSQFGLMFFQDRIQAIKEMLRVLVRGGRLAVAVWDSLENTPGYSTEVELVQRMAGELAGDALRAPFSLGAVDLLSDLIAGQGFSAVVVTPHPGIARFPSVQSMLEADLRGWLPLMGVSLAEDQIQNILKQAELSMAAYVDPEGQVTFDMPALIVTGLKD